MCVLDLGEQLRVGRGHICLFSQIGVAQISKHAQTTESASQRSLEYAGAENSRRIESSIT